MKTTYFFAWGLLLASATALAQTAPRVGIGTTTPRAGLDLSHDDGFVATGTYVRGNTDNLPTGAGVRMMWIPAKAAFRAGYVDAGEWDRDNIGSQSVALGTNTVARGQYATALGYGSKASSLITTALGYDASADGMYSMAIGSHITASGVYSTAMGTYASTNGEGGSFVVGDYSTSNLLLSSTDNDFSARFAGGYRLFSNADMTVGVSLGSGANAWSTLSDSTKKEGFRPADGPAFLQKIAALRLGSWNYRGQDARTMRHYGPMAQDFFAAFGRDGVGTVGCDTLINQADFDGVNLIAIQALVAEVERLKAENQRLKSRNAALRRDFVSLRADVDAIKQLLVAYTDK